MKHISQNLFALLLLLVAACGPDIATPRVCPLEGGDVLLTVPDQNAVVSLTSDGEVVSEALLDDPFLNRPQHVMRVDGCDIVVSDRDDRTLFSLDGEGVLTSRDQDFSLQEPVDLVSYKGLPTMVWGTSPAITVFADSPMDRTLPESGALVAASEGMNGSLWVASDVDGGTLLVEYEDDTLQTALRSTVVESEYPIPSIQSMRYDADTDTLVLGGVNEVLILDADTFEEVRSVEANGFVYQVAIDEEGTLWRLDFDGLWKGDELVTSVEDPARARFHVE